MASCETWSVKFAFVWKQNKARIKSDVNDTSFRETVMFRWTVLDYLLSLSHICRMVSDSCQHPNSCLKVKELDYRFWPWEGSQGDISDAMLATQVQDSVQTLQSTALTTQFFTVQHVGNIRSAVFLTQCSQRNRIIANDSQFPVSKRWTVRIVQQNERK